MFIDYQLNKAFLSHRVIWEVHICCASPTSKPFEINLIYPIFFSSSAKRLYKLVRLTQLAKDIKRI